MELDFSAWPSRTTMSNLAWSFIKKCKFCNLFRAGGRPSPRLASKQLFIILNQLCFWKCASAACSNVATGLEDCVCRTRLGPPRAGQQLESQMQLHLRINGNLILVRRVSSRSRCLIHSGACVCTANKCTVQGDMQQLERGHTQTCKFMSTTRLKASFILSFPCPL